MLSVASCSGVGSSRPIRKRKNNSSGRDNNAESSGVKMPKTGFYFVLESESDVTSSSGEDTESVLSIQNKSTDIAKDTSDTSSKSGSSGSDYDSLAGLEYEVMSWPEQEYEHPFDSYSSGADSAMGRVRIRDSEAEDRAEQSMWADVSSAASDQITLESAQLLPKRPRICSKCKAQTNFFQFCHDCHKARMSSFCPRPKGNSKRKTSKFPFKRKMGKEPTNLALTDSKTDSCLESSSSQELILTPSDFNKPGGKSNAEGLCNICLVNPKNGAFLHCRWVHIYSCYQCSLKVWFSSRPLCPLCNGKIRQVTKVAIG